MGSGSNSWSFLYGLFAILHNEHRPLSKPKLIRAFSYVFFRFVGATIRELRPDENIYY